MKFLIDANLPNSAKEVFADNNLDAIHVREVGLFDASDEEIFRYAQKNNRIIVTRDLDFADAIRFVPGKHCGIIVIRVSCLMSADQIKKVLRSFLEKAPFNKIKKVLVILEASRYRLRYK